MSSNKRAKTKENPTDDGEWMFRWLVHPTPIDQFYTNFWEKQPLIIHRKQADFYHTENPTFSLSELKTVLKDHTLIYGQNIDVTDYKDGKRYTFNEENKRAEVDEVMKSYNEKRHTLRILHPQEFSDNLYKICADLQEWFGCVVGCNIYVTPPGSQGFAPHYDDVDVFILQLEGRKFWRLYPPFDQTQELDDHSSRNFEQEEIGEPFMEVWLEQGDLMYFPRGVIHQALTDENVHSMHATISTVQNWNWYQYLLQAVPGALRIAFEEDVEFRRTLPRLFQDYMGVMYSDQENNPLRDQFMQTAATLAEKMLSFLPFDAAADQMAATYLHDSLPPKITPNQATKPQITVNSEIRLVSKNSVRIVAEGDGVLLYYNTMNSRKYQEVAPQFIEFPIEASDALEYLINSYPRFVSVNTLPFDDDEDKIEVARALVASKIVLVE